MEHVIPYHAQKVVAGSAILCQTVHTRHSVRMNSLVIIHTATDTPQQMDPPQQPPRLLGNLLRLRLQQPRRQLENRPQLAHQLRHVTVAIAAKVCPEMSKRF